ncbi:MAG: YhbY family RNA-binding protein [Phycisphaerae bacterium]|nr:YhbY family RNA-binding protein [Phycisphaerae bacterium]
MTTESDVPSGKNGLPELSGSERRALAARAQRLHAGVQIGARGLTDGTVAQIRQALSKHELIKIRVQADKGVEVDEVGRELARRVPCHVVRRVGKVLTVYLPGEIDPSARGSQAR